ncbi:MAG: reprolysin-like metallopeptidase [Luteibacter sp.]
MSPSLRRRRSATWIISLALLATAACASVGPPPAAQAVPEPQAPTRTLDIHVFVHDDVRKALETEHPLVQAFHGVNDADAYREFVHSAYLSWWFDDVARILPTFAVRLHYHPHIEGLSNFDYQSEDALVSWTDTVRRWARSEDLDPKHTTKFLLVTAHSYDGRSSGVAWQGGDAALAAITGRYRVIAHELGHLFGATHRNGETRHQGGWWCETNMHISASLLLQNCYGYSEENARRIRAYVIENPGWDESSAWGPTVLD